MSEKFYYTCSDDEEILTHESIEDAVADHVEEVFLENKNILNERVAIYKWESDKIDEDDRKRLAERFVGDLYEYLSENYEHPECTINTPSDEIKKLAETMCDKIVDQYTVTLCHICEKFDVDVKDYMNVNDYTKGVDSE